MKEYPILFSGEMVRAILDGRKTQTRRVLKKQPADILPMLGDAKGKTWVVLRERVENIDDQRGDVIRCRYGNVGDQLWVRETWTHDEPNCDDIHCGNPDHIWYRANEDKIVADSFAGKAHWRPSIHMERWASRIQLEIVNIRAERLHAITTPDILSEGILRTKDDFWLGPLSGYPDYPWARADLAYSALWNEINGKRGYGWDANPWVWVIEFKRVKESIYAQTR